MTVSMIELDEPSEYIFVLELLVPSAVSLFHVVGIHNISQERQYQFVKVPFAS